MQRWRPAGGKRRAAASNTIRQRSHRHNRTSGTSSERHVGKLLPGGGVVMEVPVGVELHPLGPGVPQPVVDGRRDADLVSHGDGESRRRLSRGTRSDSALLPASGRNIRESHLRCASHSHHGHDRGAEPQRLLQAALQKAEVLQLRMKTDL